MGKHLRPENSGIALENNHPGCMWSILHIIKYHHWHHVKKRLPHSRHGGSRHIVGARNGGNNINTSNADAIQGNKVAENDSSIVKVKMIHSTPAAKNSVKARIKALIAEERYKKKGRHHRSSTYPARSLLTRTNSIHRLGPSRENSLAEMILDYESPRNITQEVENCTSSQDLLLPRSNEELITNEDKCEGCSTMCSQNDLGHSQVDELGRQHIENQTPENTKQALSEKKLMHGEEVATYSSLRQSKELLDALDIIHINKELLVKVLQDPSSHLAHHFHNQQVSSAKKGLSRSETFPLLGSSNRGSVLSTLKPKTTERGSHAKELELQIGSEAQRSVEFECTEEICKRSMLPLTENRMQGTLKLKEEVAEIANNSSAGSAHHRKNRGGNQVVIKRFHDLKQKIKHAIKESRKERHRITMDAILHKIPHGHKFSKELKKKNVDHLKDPAMHRDGKDCPGSSYESDHAAPFLGKGGQRHMRRTSSLNESMERYCQLYESSFNRESKHHNTEKLKLRTEEVDLSFRNAPKSLGRILSLPDLGSYAYQSEEFSDALSSGTLAGAVMESSVSIGSSFDEQKSLDLSLGSENCLQLGTVIESGIQQKLVGVGEKKSVIGNQVGSTAIENSEVNVNLCFNIDYSGNRTAGDSVSHHEQDIRLVNKRTHKMAEPNSDSVLDSNFEEDVTTPANVSISEDLVPRHIPFDGRDSLAKEQDEADMNTLTVAESIGDLEKVEIQGKHLDSNILHVLVDAKDQTEFNYVRDVLELSGFSGNENLGIWHSDDQPVDPSVYEEVEDCFLLDPNCSGNDGGDCSHLVLFDLINEVLMEIYERSFSYYPKPLGTLSHIRPMPVGYRVLEEVWANISWYLSSRLVHDLSLDYVMSRDLAKGGGWMNLQFDTECVVIELEDLIFEDLLEEVFIDMSFWPDQVPF